MKRFSLTGLVAAPYTPFNADYSLNLGAVPRIAEHLMRQKVAGVFIGGTTGEWASLTREERRALAEAWRKACGPKLKLIVHVGHNCLADSQDLARHAESLGADAIGALMTSFFRPATLAASVDYCRRIAAAAPKTPFYFYHMPDATGVNYNMVDFLPAARELIPTFQGIKFTHSNLVDYGLTLAAAAGRYDVLFGRDEFLLAGLAFGAKGAIGSTYNYSAVLHHELMKAHAAGRREAATKIQVYIQKTMLPLMRLGGLQTGKAVEAMAGVDCGPVRPPLTPLTPKQLQLVKAELDALDFFSKIKV